MQRRPKVISNKQILTERGLEPCPGGNKVRNPAPAGQGSEPCAHRHHQMIAGYGPPLSVMAGHGSNFGGGDGGGVGGGVGCGGQGVSPNAGVARGQVRLSEFWRLSVFFGFLLVSGHVVSFQQNQKDFRCRSRKNSKNPKSPKNHSKPF